MSTIIRLSFFAVFIVALFFLLTSNARAFTDPADIAECERRNLIYGCTCDCADPAMNRVCGENVDTCTLVISPSGSGNVSEFLGVEVFPSVGTNNVLLIVDSNGNLLLGETIANAFRWLFWLLGGAAIVLGIYGGFLYSTAGGEDEKVETAQSIFKNALIGFTIAIAGLLIVVLLSSLLGFNESGETIDDSLENDRTPAEREQDRQDQRDFFNDLFN
jgi:hypothetical protein